MRLFLVGTGPLDAELRSRVRQLGLTDSVVFLGTRQDAREILPAFDALVLPSRNEGLGLVLVEALAAGVPVVATHVGGIPEVLGGFDGAILVPPNDAHLLASALRDVVSDPTFSEKAYAFGLAHVSRFDIDHAVQRMTDVYHHVVGRTQGGDG